MAVMDRDSFARTMTPAEKARCKKQIAAMKTRELREFAAMMDMADGIEFEALTMACEELTKRGLDSPDRLESGAKSDDVD